VLLASALDRGLILVGEPDLDAELARDVGHATGGSEMMYVTTRAEWDAARVLVRHILREPGALSERSIALLRGAVLPQLDAALAMPADGYPTATLARWNAFLPGAVASVGPDAELARVERHLRSGLAALSA
jgi:hypothetical protein